MMSAYSSGALHHNAKLTIVGLTAIGAYLPPAAAPVGKRGARVRWVDIARARILSRADDTAYLPRRCAAEEAAECRPAAD